MRLVRAELGPGHRMREHMLFRQPAMKRRKTGSEGSFPRNAGEVNRFARIGRWGLCSGGVTCLAAEGGKGNRRTQGARRGLDRRLRLIEERAHGTRAGRPRHTHRPRPHARLLSTLSEDGWVGYSGGGRVDGNDSGSRGKSIELGRRSRVVGNSGVGVGESATGSAVVKVNIDTWNRVAILVGD